MHNGSWVCAPICIDKSLPIVNMTLNSRILVDMDSYTDTYVVGSNVLVVCNYEC